MARLIIQSGERAGEAFPLEGEPLSLGRLASNGIAIPDTKASRIHARVYLSEGSYTLADLHSQNGTHVNGRPVSRTRLRHGDRIVIGATEILFDDEPGAAASSAAPISAAAVPTPRTPQAAAGLVKDRGALVGATPDDIEFAEGPLQFSPHRGDRTRSVLREDLGQTAGAFRILAAIAGIAVLAGAAAGAAWLTLSVLR